MAEESSASAEQVSASTQQTSASAQEIAASAQTLSGTAEHLNALVPAASTVSRPSADRSEGPATPAGPSRYCRRMGFLDKAKKLAEQAQTKLDEVQTQVNSRRLVAAAQRPGRRVRQARPADPAAADGDAAARRPARRAAPSAPPRRAGPDA